MDTSRSQDIFVPNTWTLKNKLGIRDREELSSIELTLSSIRAEEGIPNGRLDYKHLKAIHKHLFQDVYEWAGEERDIETRKHSNEKPFTHPEKISSNLNLSLDMDLTSLNGMSKNDVANTIARVSNSINTAHPFLEGNGRATREFINQLSKHTSFRVDWHGVDRKEWNSASKEAFEGNQKPLTKLYQKHLIESEKNRTNRIRKQNDKTLTSQQIKALYPEMVALADKLDFQTKIKSSTDKSQNMLKAFTQKDKDASIIQYPELKKYYVIRQKNYEKIELLGRDSTNINRLKSVVDMKIAHAILKPINEIQSSKDKIER